VASIKTRNIIYTKNKEIGIKELEEIREQKEKQGIKVTLYNRSYNMPSYTFSDGEVWIILQPIDANRAYRWSKCRVDAKNTTMAEWINIIRPAEVGSEQIPGKCIFFNIV
jgi:hypothetical protein